MTFVLQGRYLWDQGEEVPVQVTGSGSPTVRRRELGALLRALRLEAGMTIEQVAEQLLCSPSKISRMETGLRGTSQRDIRDLCSLYEVTDPAQREHLYALAGEGRAHAWWQPFDLPPGLSTYVGLEAEASRISDYEPGIVPGLLHIPEYAGAIHERSIPRLSDEEIARRVMVRHMRQAILTRNEPPPPQFQAVIDEAALHRVVGGPIVMSAQLRRVIQASELPNVTVQVLAYEAGAHPALDSTFNILEFTNSVPKVVYIEGLLGHFYLERPNETEKYEQVFERLQEISLSERNSIKLMTKLAAAYNNGCPKCEEV